MVTENIETRLEFMANWICLITKQERERVSVEILMFSVTKPFHTGSYKYVNATFYMCVV